MPSPSTVDFEPLFAPIPGDNPSGMSLAYSPEYDRIREARRSDEDLDQGDWQRELKVADWDRVIQLCTRCLAAQTKDLQIAAWMAEGLVRLHGFAGLRDALIVLKGIQERFWETYYPEVDDGDLESRHGPFLFLNDPFRGLPSLIRNVPVTRGVDDQNYTTRLYRESRETDNLIKKDPDSAAEILGSGRITGQMFDDAVAQTRKVYYVGLVADLKEAREALEALVQDTDERFGNDAPSLLEVSKAIDEGLRLLDPILAAKLKAEPDPVAAPPPGEGGEASEGENGRPLPGGGAIAFDGVGIPTRRARLGTAYEGEAPDFGRLLIDFRERAQALAEAGAKLNENRERYAELLAEMSRLDDEYEEVSAVVSRNLEAYQLVARLLNVQAEPVFLSPPPESPPEE